MIFPRPFPTLRTGAEHAYRGDLRDREYHEEGGRGEAPYEQG